MKNTIIIGLLVLAFMSCGESPKQDKDTSTSDAELSKEQSELNKTAMALFGTLPLVAENPENLITTEKVELGKKLYFDNRLSKDNTQSCNTCHNLDTYGVDNKALSEGNDGGLGGRNSPTTFNAALHLSQFWDGREPDVEAQAGGPILNPVEMAMPSEEAVIEKLSGIEEYVTLFAKAFPKDESSLTYTNLKKAIGAFERKLITPTRFHDYLAGDENALTKEEKEGLQTYINVGCTTCHIGSALGGSMYQKFGLFADYWELTKSETVDNGKFDVTQKEADKYVFKVPSLLNIEKTYPYFHDGSVMDLDEAIVIMGKTELNKELNEQEVASIATFLKALNGEVDASLKQ